MVFFRQKTPIARPGERFSGGGTGYAFFPLFPDCGLDFCRNRSTVSAETKLSEQKMTEVRVEVKTLLKTRKWMLSLNYIPAGF